MRASMRAAVPSARRLSAAPKLRDPSLLRQDLFIEGQWRAETSGGARISVLNPSNGAVIASVPNAGEAETAAAIAAAERAFPAWSHTTAAERAAVLRRLQTLHAEHREDLMTLENGKPLAESRGEVNYSASFYDWFAGEAPRVYGDVIPPHTKSTRIMVRKQPVGVVGMITPWNFPSAMIARKLAAALAAGCTVVCKPSELTPLSALAVAELATRAGVPPGVFNVVTGDAARIGATLTSDARVRKITFTGSTRVGKLLLQQSAATVKRVSMELGGNAPFIVFDDANVTRAVDGIMQSKFRNCGQTCVSANRILVQSGVYDAVCSELASRVRQVRVGDGFEDGVQLGPLINSAAVAKVREVVADAVAMGAEVLAGGKPHARGGNYFEPTVLTRVRSGMRAFREEVFGPVAPLVRFDTEAEAVKLANATPAGLAAYFYTDDVARAFRVSEALQYGMVGVNEPVISTAVAPFGGVKESGLGREGSKYGLDDYLDIKYVCYGGVSSELQS
jgi:succinate-semialdehyde dehydrogenase/glutarate-semialdehyde dehydrogenase